MVQQPYSNNPVTFSYIDYLIQKVATVLSILLMILEGKIRMNIRRYFQSTRTIGIEGYEYNKN